MRVAFATLRSDGDPNHPNPQSDEMDERTYLVRVVDVDEAPSFRGADSDQSIDENSDDDLPAIEINRDVGGSVTATDPEDTCTPDPEQEADLQPRPARGLRQYVPHSPVHRRDSDPEQDRL